MGFVTAVNGELIHTSAFNQNKKIEWDDENNVHHIKNWFTFKDWTDGWSELTYPKLK